MSLLLLPLHLRRRCVIAHLFLRPYLAPRAPVTTGTGMLGQTPNPTSVTRNAYAVRHSTRTSHIRLHHHAQNRSASLNTTPRYMMDDTVRLGIPMHTKTDMEWSMDVCRNRFHPMPLSRCPRMDVARPPPSPDSNFLEPPIMLEATHVPQHLFIHSHFIKRTYLSNSVGIAAVPPVLTLSYHHLFLITYHNTRTMYLEPSRFVFTPVHPLRLHVSSTPLLPPFVFVSCYLSWTVCIIILASHFSCYQCLNVWTWSIPVCTLPGCLDSSQKSIAPNVHNVARDTRRSADARPNERTTSPEATLGLKSHDQHFELLITACRHFVCVETPSASTRVSRARFCVVVGASTFRCSVVPYAFCSIYVLIRCLLHVRSCCYRYR